MNDRIGPWRIKDLAEGDDDLDRASRGQGEGWIAAEAPGDVYRALIAAGRLADPYAARNETAAAWVRDRVWWWHTPLDIAGPASGETVELLFEGLDTFADVYLDGVLLGRADNMFRSWRFDLADIVPGRHDLALCFHPATAMTGDAPLPTWSAFADRISHSRRTMMRKAQFGWGWDWGPDLPTVGIWRPVRIERRRAATVRSLNFTTLAIGPDAAEVRIDLDLTAPGDVAVDLLGPDGALVASASRHGSGALCLTVPDPQLWWTADLGAQPLYTVAARIAGSPDYRTQIGIRTIAIDQSPDPDEPGATFFRFILNGVSIFAKGANWVPASSFVGAIPDDTYRDLLERAVAANMNMIRVWGGGMYEPDLFYEECDRLGLLVWQDFMFACAPYPDDDPAMVENIRQEVIEQVDRLRHHACLALWCGNNENQALQYFTDLTTGAETPLVGRSLFEELIPAVCAERDPATPYWPGSPWGGGSPNSMRGGDVHNWTVWHGIPLVLDADPIGDYDRTPEGLAFTRYAEDVGRFISEFGLQSAPDIGTLRRWMAPKDLAVGSEGLLERIKDVADKATAMMIPVTGLPTTIDAFVDFTMIAQAEGLQFGIEHYRRRKPHCSGALIWQHNDCWPCVSWSLIDYDGVAKASFYATTRAFAPVLASFRRDGDRAELWITNDTLAALTDTATITFESFAGGGHGLTEVAIDVPANGSLCVWRGEAPAADQVLTVRSANGRFAGNRLLPAMVKDLPLDPEPGLRASHKQADGAIRFTIAADRYALAVRLRSDDPTLRYSDNHFDLAGGETRTILVTARDGKAIVPESIEISCWNTRYPWRGE